MQKKYALRMGYDYTQKRKIERDDNVELIIEDEGKESDGFLRLAGGKKFSMYNQEDPREVYYKKMINKWESKERNKKEKEETNEIHQTKINVYEEELQRIDWDEVDIEEFFDKMREERENDETLVELRKKDQLKEESNKKLREFWNKNKELNEFLETFEDEDTDIESLPDVDEKKEKKTFQQILDEIKEEEKKAKGIDDKIDYKKIMQEMTGNENVEFYDEDGNLIEDWEEDDEYEYEIVEEQIEEIEEEYEYYEEEVEYEEEIEE